MVLLGRERELAAALEMCGAAGAGRGSVLVPVGEPGIGKTALLAAVVDGGGIGEVLHVTIPFR